MAARGRCGLASCAKAHVVWLGEPGIGKSDVLAVEAEVVGRSPITAQALLAGLANPSTTPLFVDGLDEHRAEGGAGDKVHALARMFIETSPGFWRVACRSEDWRSAVDLKALSAAAKGGFVIVAQVLPLEWVCPDQVDGLGSWSAGLIWRVLAWSSSNWTGDRYRRAECRRRGL